MDKKKITIILGPTASGKSALAIDLSPLFNAEIINADSMQVYRFMDIGTAKPDRADREKVVHHLIDVVNPDEDYTVAAFRKDASEKIEEITRRGKNVFVVGGTGLYIKALAEGLFEGPERDLDMRESLLDEARIRGEVSLYERLKRVDPVSASAIHPNNLRRVVRALEVYYLTKRPLSDFHREHAFSERPYDALKIGLLKERAGLYADIEERVDWMMREGLLDEARRLKSMGYGTDLKPMAGLGYKEMCLHLNGAIALEEAVELLKRNTRRYAKRQLTWFRKDPEIRWFYPEERNGITGLISRHLS